MPNRQKELYLIFPLFPPKYKYDFEILVLYQMLNVNAKIFANPSIK